MTVETFIPALVFSSELTDIEISDVTKNIHFSMSYKSVNEEEHIILTENYVADTDNRVLIIGVDDILMPYLLENPVLDVVFKFRYADSADYQVYESRIVLSRSELNVDTRSFLHQRFLTIMSGDKTVLPNSLEYICLYPIEQEQWQIDLTYRDQQGGEIEYNIISGEELEEEKLHVLNVSPAQYSVEGKSLLNYTIRCGARTMTYYVDHLHTDTSLEVMFSNNFGLPETFSTRADWTSERKFTNEFGKVRGQYKKYHVAFDKEYTANTGVLDQDTANWIEADLFSSMNVFEIKDRQKWKAITIFDQTVKRSSSKSELPAFEFKYRLEQKNQEVRAFWKYLYRIFDDTFDETFN